MDVLGREDDHDFRQYIFEKSKRSLVSDAKGTMLKRFTRTGEFGINGQHLFGMTGHLDFGNDGNALPRCMGNQLACFCLRVITAASVTTAHLQVTARKCVV